MNGQRRNPLIEKAIAAGGGSQAELARRAGCAQQHVSKLLLGEITITPALALGIARATSGAVRLADLMPDFVKAVLEEADFKQPVTPERVEAAA